MAPPSEEFPAFAPVAGPGAPRRAQTRSAALSPRVQPAVGLAILQRGLRAPALRRMAACCLIASVLDMTDGASKLAWGILVVRWRSVTCVSHTGYHIHFQWITRRGISMQLVTHVEVTLLEHLGHWAAAVSALAPSHSSGMASLSACPVVCQGGCYIPHAGCAAAREACLVQQFPLHHEIHLLQTVLGCQRADRDHLLPGMCHRVSLF